MVDRMEKYVPHETLIPDDLKEKIYIKLLGDLRGVTVYLVDGEFVRDQIDVDFVLGGNAGVYSYIPEKQIWIDEFSSPKDIAPDILHEYSEYMRMIEGMSYAEAHEEASALEKVLRQTDNSEEDSITIVDKFLSGKEIENMKFTDVLRDIKTSSILDYPKAGLDPSVWGNDNILKKEIEDVIYKKFFYFLKEKGIDLNDTDIVDGVKIIGSLTTYQYNSTSDLDVHIFLNVEKLAETLDEDVAILVETVSDVWRKELEVEGAIEFAPKTRHPLQYYFETPGFVPEGKDKGRYTDGIYNVFTKKWEQEPREVDIEFDSETKYADAIGYIEDLVGEFDVEIGDVKRNIEDISYLQETLSQLPPAKKKSIKERLDKKIQEINDSIDLIVGKGQDVIEERKKHYDVDSDENIHFKFLERYSYIWLIKNLEKSLENVDEEVEIKTEEDVAKVKDILEKFESAEIKVSSKGVLKEVGHFKLSMTDLFEKQADLQSKLPYLIKQYKDLSEEEAVSEINVVNQADPTGSYAIYTPWLVKLDVSKVSLFPEDSSKLKEMLTVFEKVKNLGVSLNKDINSYSSYSDLARALEPYQETKSKGEEKRELVSTGSEEVYNDGTCKVIKILTPEAASDICYKKEAVHWCIKDVKFAKEYLAQGPLYMIFDHNRPYVLAHEESQSLMSFFDEPITDDMYEGVSEVIDAVGLKFFKYDVSALVGLKEWKGDLDLGATQVKELPEGLTIGGHLNLSDPQVKELPKGLTVGESLFLSGTQIKELPEDLIVKGEIYDFKGKDLRKKSCKIGDTNLYALPITELKSKYTDGIIRDAIGIWQKKDLPDDEITNKIIKITRDLESASKKEFIAIYESYKKAGCKIIIASQLENLSAEARNFDTAEEFLDDIVNINLGEDYAVLKPLVKQIPIEEFGVEGAIEAEQGIQEKVTTKWIERIKSGARPFVIWGSLTDGGFTHVVDGHHRLEAYRELGFTHVPAVYTGDILDFYYDIREKDWTIRENLKTAKEKMYDASTIQTSEVPKPLINAIKKIQKALPKEALYTFEDDRGWIDGGLQKLFHITVLFGVDDNSAGEVANVFSEFNEIQVKTGKLGYLRELKDGKYKVLVLEIESEDLSKLHKALKKKLKNKHTSNFTPHLTIAYLKPGTRIDPHLDGSFEWTIKDIEISKTDGTVDEIRKKSSSMRELVAEMPLEGKEWIGVDLDKTLAYYDHWRGIKHIGKPILHMLEKVKELIGDGNLVKIFTARASIPGQIPYIEEWCIKNGLGILEVTNVKDHNMVKFYDDKAVSVIENTGISMEDALWDDTKEWLESESMEDWLGTLDKNGYKIAENVEVGISFEEYVLYGNTKQIDLFKNGIGIGGIKFILTKDGLVVDMIRINTEEDKFKGYASRLLEQVIDKYNPKIITASEDGFSSDGRSFFEAFATSHGYNFDGETLFIENSANKILTKHSWDTMLLDTNEEAPFADFKYHERYEKPSMGHRPFMRGDEPNIQQQEEFINPKDKLFFGPAYPKNVRRHFRLKADVFKFDPNSTVNEGRWRLRDPADFEIDTIRRWNYWGRLKAPQGIQFVVGNLKEGSKKKAVQAIRFNKKLWSEEDASKWWGEVKDTYGLEKSWTPNDWEKVSMKEALVRECAWCKDILGEKPPFEDKRVTHSICEKCQETYFGDNIEEEVPVFAGKNSIDYEKYLEETYGHL